MLDSVTFSYASPRRPFECQCGKPVFFHNTTCLACGTPLGYDPDAVLLRPLEPEGDGLWRALSVAGAASDVPLKAYRRCANFTTAATCNWLLDSDEPDTQTLCKGCRLVRTIPDTSLQDGAGLWAKTEAAKQAVVAQLMSLGLPVQSKMSEDPARGVMFDLLRTLDAGPKVMTGHDTGLITLDVAEAEDAHREKVRARMHEPYRTLIGHVRHELGHYYWERIVRGTDWEAPCRALFGDDRRDYGQALQAYYDRGAPLDWRDAFVSEYATAHPYEDWAETWAHYLHMIDAYGTARSFDLRPSGLMDFDPFPEEALASDGRALDPSDREFLSMVNRWTELTVAMNQVTRSMGEPDFYPFVLSRPAIQKLHFIHRVVHGARSTRATSPAGGVASAPCTVPSRESRIPTVACQQAAPSLADRPAPTANPV